MEVEPMYCAEQVQGRTRLLSHYQSLDFASVSGYVADQGTSKFG